MRDFGLRYDDSDGLAFGSIGRLYSLGDDLAYLDRPGLGNRDFSGCISAGCGFEFWFESRHGNLGKFNLGLLAM